MTFDPTSVEVTCVTVPKDHYVQVPWEYVNVCGYSYQFCKNYHIHTYTHILRTYYVHTTYYVQNQWSHSLSGETTKKKLQKFAINLKVYCNCENFNNDLASTSWQLLSFLRLWGLKMQLCYLWTRFSWGVRTPKQTIFLLAACRLISDSVMLIN